MVAYSVPVNPFGFCCCISGLVRRNGWGIHKTQAGNAMVDALHCSGPCTGPVSVKTRPHPLNLFGVLLCKQKVIYSIGWSCLLESSKSSISTQLFFCVYCFYQLILCLVKYFICSYCTFLINFWQFSLKLSWNFFNACLHI